MTNSQTCENSQTGESKAHRCIVVLGPTATGKTRYAVELAQRLAGEVISVDSRQVYQGLDLGTGKDLIEYGQVSYHLIDVCPPHVEFSLFDYLSQTQTVLTKLATGEQCPVFAGGTGLYLAALLQTYRLSNAPLNEVLRAELATLNHDQLVRRLATLRPLHNQTDSVERDRLARAIEIAEAEASGNAGFVQIRLRPTVIGLRCPSDRLRDRIWERLHQRLNAGMVDEVASLHDKGLSWQRLQQLGLEYRYLAWFLQGQLNRNDMQQKLASAIYQFARKQNKWFRRLERSGIAIRWLDCDQLDEAALIKAVAEFESRRKRL